MQNQAVIKVYVDLVFFANLIMDGAVLWLAGRLMGVCWHWKRWTIASVIGAAYATATLLWPYSLLNSTFGKVLCSVLITYISYKPNTAYLWLRLFACFYLAAFAIGGTIIGLWFLFQNQVWDIGNWINQIGSLRFAVIGLLLTIGLQFFVIGRAKKHQHRANYFVDFAMEYNGEKIKLTALADTGHDLIEPIAGGPVVCLTLSSLPLKMACKLSEQGWSNLPKLKCKTLTNQGYLSIFKPDRVWIKEKSLQNWIEIPFCWIGLVPMLLNQEDRYQALIPGLLLDKLTGSLSGVGKEDEINGHMEQINNWTKENNL